MDYFAFYSKYFKDLKSIPPKQNVLCLFHEDKIPSLSVNLESGLWYCHACKKGGDIFNFYMQYENCNFKQAKHAILGKRDISILSIGEVEEAHKRLLNNQYIVNILYAKKFWSKETIINFKLGWENERVTIPIFDKEGSLINIRKYDILHKFQDKFKGIPGCNEITLFPQSTLEKDPIIIFAGEPDTILASQFGFPAITFTGGEGNISNKLLPAFKNKTVYICYDTDEQGKRGTDILANKLCSIAKQVKIIELPENIIKPPAKDFTDLLFTCIEQKFDFNKIWNEIVDSAEIFTLIEQKGEKYDDYFEVDFIKAVDPMYYNKNIKFKASVIGSTMSPYFCPSEILIKCNMSKGDSCKSCGLFFSGGEFKYLIPQKYAPELINLDSEKQKRRLRELAGIQKCNTFELTVNNIETIEAIWMIPQIEKETIEQKFISRKGYITTYNIQTNKSYMLYGKTIPDPEDQTATHWFTKAEPMMESLQDFKLSDDYKDALKIFNPEENTIDAVELKFLEICEDLTYNAPETAIIGREDLMIAFDLVYHSVLKFNFLGNEINKGWIECLILGDTGTGKTISALKLLRHYHLGEYITLEKATTAGIIGGISNIGNANIFTWGIFPINDGRLVILDEVNGLDQTAISDLSAIRSTGIAERTIVGSTRRTQARVRTIWISNPRSNVRSIKYYSSGVEAIRELIGRAEDIQRFDFAVIVGADEVSAELINSPIKKKVIHKFTSELCNKLILWTWSRKPTDIKFEFEAEKLILKTAIEMGNKYSDSIPLVQVTTQRIKLARLAVATACRMFSTTDGENVIVKPFHVEFVKSYLDRIYNTPNFNYGDWSLVNKKEAEVVDSMDYVKKLIYNLDDPLTFCSKVLDARDISIADLEDFTRYTDRDKVRWFRTELIQNNCIKRIGNFYKKNPEFTIFIKQLFKHLREREKKDGTLEIQAK